MPGLTKLRAFAARKTFVERCGLCAAVLPAEHEHLVERGGRRLQCACPGCALVFEGDTGRYRRVPRDARRLAAFDVPDGLWSELDVPVDLVFFRRVEGRARAFYPSPEGVLESTLRLEAWAQVVARNPALEGLREDVEALLVNRVRGAREAFIAPIDECFRLIGLIRSHWSGFTGGDAVREKTDEFFARLRARADAV